MSAEILDFTNGILTGRMTGTLKHADLVAAQTRAAELIQKHGKIRLLTLLEDFQGTEKEGDWGNISFQMEFDDHIEKIAIVGDKQWRDLSLMFTGKGIRRMPIEFFETADLEKAKAWIAA